MVVSFYKYKRLVVELLVLSLHDTAGLNDSQEAPHTHFTVEWFRIPNQIRVYLDVGRVFEPRDIVIVLIQYQIATGQNMKFDTRFPLRFMKL